MGLFFSGSKKIYKEDFKKALRGIPQLSQKERTYVESVFQKSLRGGLSKFELTKEINRLRRNDKDLLEPSEVKKIKEKLSKSL